MRFFIRWENSKEQTPLRIASSTGKNNGDKYLVSKGANKVIKIIKFPSDLVKLVLKKEHHMMKIISLSKTQNTKQETRTDLIHSFPHFFYYLRN